MIDDYYQLSSITEKIILQEKPTSILEISSYQCCYAHLFMDCLKELKIESYQIDRITLETSVTEQLYHHVYPIEQLYQIDTLPDYDFIFIAHLFEIVTPQEVKNMVEQLQDKVSQQILMIIPENLPGFNQKQLFTGKRCRPITFLGLDFVSSMMASYEKNWRFYSVFKKKKMEPMPIDQSHTTAVSNLHLPEKFRIAYVLPHKQFTDSLKTALQHIRHLTKRGHLVSVFLCSNQKEETCAIPEWSDLSDNDYALQKVLPESKSFLRKIDQTDIIIMGKTSQIVDFSMAKAPVVLWEEEKELLTGDYGKLIFSHSPKYRILQNMYRSPIRLLSFSNMVASALESRYARKAYWLPYSFDAEFFYSEEKRNETPIILLDGNVHRELEAFSFIFRALDKAWQSGLAFKVHWIGLTPQKGKINLPFPLTYTARPPYNQLLKFYYEADILIGTSFYEPLSVSVMQAMAAGVAVISINSGVSNPVIKHRENCLCCEADDVDGLCSTITDLVHHEDIRKTLAKSAQKAVFPFSHQQTVQQLEHYFNNILLNPETKLKEDK